MSFQLKTALSCFLCGSTGADLNIRTPTSHSWRDAPEPESRQRRDHDDTPLLLSGATVVSAIAVFCARRWKNCLNLMIYASEAGGFKAELKQVIATTRFGVHVMRGIALLRLSEKELLRQIDLARRSGCEGVTLFACAQLNLSASMRAALMRVAARLLSPYRKDDDEQLAQLDECRRS